MKLTSLSIFQDTSVESNFLTAIERAFSKFGENKSHIVFSKFETDYNLSRNEILDHPELFSRTVQKIFRFGASYVERAMIIEVVEEFSLPKSEYKQLADVAQKLRRK